MFLPIAAASILLFLSCNQSLGFIAQRGQVTGMVLDVASKFLMEGVSVTVVETGESTTTDRNGEFWLETSKGSHTLHFTMEGYTFFDATVVVSVGRTVAVDRIVAGYGPLASDQYRIILTWEEKDTDLEAKLRLPNLDTVDHDNRTANDGSANLEWYDEQSYAITITAQNPGTYDFVAANYMYSGFWSSPSAAVRVYDDSGLWQTFDLLYVGGDIFKPYWRVFSLSESNLTALNTISNSAW